MPSPTVFVRGVVYLGLTSLALVACGGGGSQTAPSNPTPSLISVSPASVTVGSNGVSITASGSGFISSSTVMWNGTSLPTSYTNSTTLTAQVSAADLLTSGTATVTVTNPSPGGGNSSGVTFTISNPTPSLTSVSPASAPAGTAGTSITVSGSNFVRSSTVIWNYSVLPTTYTNSTTLTAQVSAADLQTPGEATVTVTSPSPGGGDTVGVTFIINPPGVNVVNILAYDLAWDPVNQVIYLSLPSIDGPMETPCRYWIR